MAPRVSPSLWAGGGLKRQQPVHGIARVNGFPQPLGWGRIETRFGAVGFLHVFVSPSLWAGGGLKRSHPGRASSNTHVSPSLWAGGGLKRSREDASRWLTRTFPPAFGLGAD